MVAHGSSGLPCLQLLLHGFFHGTSCNLDLHCRNIVLDGPEEKLQKHWFRIRNVPWKALEVSSNSLACVKHFKKSLQLKITCVLFQIICRNRFQFIISLTKFYSVFRCSQSRVFPSVAPMPVPMEIYSVGCKLHINGLHIHMGCTCTECPVTPPGDGTQRVIQFTTNLTL